MKHFRGNKSQKLLLILFFFSTALKDVLAQNTIQPPTIIPPSPAAQTFMRYGEIPVDYSTGVPDIAIPIYTLEGRQLKVPISISYHASGIKVNDISSEVGLGWALNCGGLVSRTVNGLRDEESVPCTYHNAADFLNGVNTATNVPYDQSSTCLDGIRDFENYLNQTLGVGEDPMKDRYFYRLPSGQSGVFTYDFVSNTVVTLPYRPLKIENVVQWNGSWHSIASIKITDVDGTVYTFQTYLQSPGPNLSEWYIKDMTSADGSDKITFNYVLQTPNPSVFNPLQTYQGWAENINSSCQPNNLPSSMSAVNSSNPLYGTPALQSIVSSKGIVTFEYASRSDFSYLKRLTKISIAAVNSPNDIIKTVELGHKYFGSASEDMRLALDNVVISAPSDTHPQKYSFGYEDQPLPAYPFKMNIPTYSEDYWGYYNGNNSGNWNNLIPSDFIPETSDQSSYGGNREGASYDVAKACMLKNITYPTGGKTVFGFERYYASNLYPYKNAGGYVGGFRVASITNYTDDNTIANVKTYGYELPVTKQIVAEDFVYDQNFTEKKYTDPTYPDVWCWSTYSRKIVSSQPLLPLEVAPGMAIMYEKVTEYDGTLANNSGKTVYTYNAPYSPCDFLNNPDHPFQYESPRFYHPYNYDKGNYVSQLDSKTVYSFDGTSYHPLTKEQNYYSPLFSTTYNTGIKVTRLKQFPGPDYWCFICSDFSSCGPTIGLLEAEYRDNIVAVDTKAYQEASLLTNSKSYVYNPLDENKYILTSTDFTYNQNNLEIKDKSTTSSKGDLFTYSYKYPFDFSGTEPYNTMISRHIWSPVIEQITSEGTGLVSIHSSRTDYNFWDGFSWKTTPSNFIVPQTVDTKTAPQLNYDTRLRYTSYDDQGNVTTVSKENDVKKTYIWGYNKSYPVAEITNADYATAIQYVDQSVLDNPSDDGRLRDELNHLRDNLPNALVSTYTYKPLVGMTSATDANNRTTYFIYDAFGRLVLVKDQNGKIVKKYCYNYMGQQEDCSIDISPQWVSTGNYQCVTDGSGNNTGYQQREEKDNNPSSSTYLQLRWTDNGYNTSSCPLPNNCDYNLCHQQGESYACIDGQCESGFMVYTDSWFDGYEWVCTYHYEYSDGSWSMDYYQYSAGQCW